MASRPGPRPAAANGVSTLSRHRRFPQAHRTTHPPGVWRFFTALHDGQYDRAASLFVGCTIIEHLEPHPGPRDLAALRLGCTVNGLQCLRVQSIELEKQVSPFEYAFKVEFENEDGSLFVMGPCCGADESMFTPVSQLPYTVIKVADGDFRVQELPVSLP
jgi:hypothetical protein